MKCGWKTNKRICTDEGVTGIVIRLPNRQPNAYALCADHRDSVLKAFSDDSLELISLEELKVWEIMNS